MQDESLLGRRTSSDTYDETRTNIPIRERTKLVWWCRTMLSCSDRRHEFSRLAADLYFEWPQRHLCEGLHVGEVTDMHITFVDRRRLNGLYHGMPPLTRHTYTFGNLDTKTMLSEMELCRSAYRNYVDQREGTPIYMPAKTPNCIWEEHMKDLHLFKQRHDHCRVPRNYSDNPKLGRWVMNVRSHFQLLQKGKKSTLITEERLQQLQEIDFDFAPKYKSHTKYYVVRWEQHLEELFQFKQKHGHCRVPQRSKATKRLGSWVLYVRHQYHKHNNGQPSRMTTDRIEQLKQIGFDFEPRRGRPGRFDSQSS